MLWNSVKIPSERLPISELKLPHYKEATFQSEIDPLRKTPQCVIITQIQLELY